MFYDELVVDPFQPIEGGSCSDYDYGCADSINNYDLDGTRCWTGVARRVREKHYEKRGVRLVIVYKTREICRSIVRGTRGFFKTHHFERTRCVVSLYSSYRGSRITGMPPGSSTGPVNVGGNCGLIKVPPEPERYAT